MIPWLTGALMLTGTAFILIAGLGLLRLPDVLCRSLAVAKASTLGIFLVLLGLWLILGVEAAGLKILLAIFFQVATIPVASHLVALLAWDKDLPRWRGPGGPQRGRGPAGRPD